MRKIIAVLALLLAMPTFADDKVVVTGLARASSPDGLFFVARNETNETLASVTIVFKLLDSGSNMVGNVTAHGGGLGPGQTWRSMVPTSIRFSNAEVVRVTTD